MAGNGNITPGVAPRDYTPPWGQMGPRSLRGRSQPGCKRACAVRISATFWPVEPLLAGKSSKIRPRAVTFSPRSFLPRRLLGANGGFHVHRNMENPDNEHRIFIVLFVVDHVRRMGKLAIAIENLIACSAHSWALRQSAKNLVNLFQVRVTLPNAPVLGRKPANRLQILKRRLGQVKRFQPCSAFSSDTGAS